MRKVRFLARIVVPAVVVLAACGVDSPTGTELSPDRASLAKKAEPTAKPQGCAFTTPNAKAHTVPAASARCPTAAEVAGTYQVTRLLVTQEGVTYDILANDETFLEITLHQDGTTSGYLFVPGNPGEEGSGKDVSLAGTWHLDGNQVTFQHDEETDIEEVAYSVQGRKLVGFGEGVLDDIDIDIVLSRK